MQKKKGISLIVLVITIIVMIILAGSIILTLSQNGIIGRANEAVSETNLKQVQQAAMLAWADAYAGGARDVDDLKDAVEQALEDANVDLDKYEITVTVNGVTVAIKETTTPPVEDPDEEEGGNENTTPTQLATPTISLSEDTLTITDNAENGSYTASFEVYVGEEKQATITASSETTFDLTTLELEAGTYTITVKAVASEDTTITASEASTAVEYVVEEATTTLGDLVATAANYGDVVNYTVTVNAGETTETTIDDWRVFYKQTVQNATTGTSEEYVYLIASEKLAANAIPTKLAATVAEGGAGATINGQNIYWASGSAPSSAASGTINKDLWLANWNNGVYNTNDNAKCVSYFLDEQYWTSFKNTDGYKDASGNTYVVGAIGTPTAEMFVASWNAKREATGDTTTYNKKLSLDANRTTGYYVNDITTSGSETTTATSQSIATTDDLYIWSTTSGTAVWLAAPHGDDARDPVAANIGGTVSGSWYYNTFYGVRPIVCLKSNIPAYAQGEGDAKTIVLDVD